MSPDASSDAGFTAGVWHTGTVAMGYSVPVQMEKGLVHVDCFKSDLFPVRVVLCLGCPFSPILSMTLMVRISLCSEGRRIVRFGDLSITSLLLSGDVVLLDAPERFATKCDAAEMRN